MTDLIKAALLYCGYDQDEVSEETLVACFLDYVDGGCFNNLTLEEAVQMIEEGELTVTDMCKNLLRTY